MYVVTDGRVIYSEELLTEWDRDNSVRVDELPEPERVEGKVGILTADVENQTVYYEYKDRPEVPRHPVEDRVEDLQSAVDSLVMAQLLGGND